MGFCGADWTKWQSKLRSDRDPWGNGTGQKANHAWSPGSQGTSPIELDLNESEPNEHVNQHSQKLRQSLKEIGEGFMQEFLEVELERHPDNLEALAELGQVYTVRGMWDRGLDVDKRLVALMPTDPTAHYNLACSQSLLGLTEDALGSLATAVNRGYGDAEFMSTDEDLSGVRGDPRFRSLLERIRSNPISGESQFPE